MKFMEWRRYSDIEMWQSEGREILETNENVLPSLCSSPAKSRAEVEDGSRDVFYVDNYIDWEQYNTLCGADFAETGRLATKS